MEAEISRPTLPFHVRYSGALLQYLSYIAMAVLVIAIGAPIFWMLTGTVKTNQQIYTFPPVWLPSNPNWSNFSDAWRSAPFGRFYVNSIVITVLGAGAELLNATFSAYALVFLRFPLKNLVFIILLAALMVPDQVAILPNYLTISHFLGFNLINTYWGLVLPGASVAFGTFLLRQAFLGLPREVLDAARVDGCGHVRMLRDMVVPMSKPMIITFGLISMVAKWNEYLWPLIVTNEQKMRPLAVGVAFLFNPEGVTNWGQVMAGSFFVITPMIAIYLLAQRHIIEGITAGATKG